jgi:hypothetical protein
VRTQAVGPAALIARPFSFAGKDLLTIVVKGTGAFDPETGEVALRSTPFLVLEDRIVRDALIGSLEHATDVALFVPRPEIVVTGKAHAIGGPAREVAVALALLRGERRIFQKSPRVVGDRLAPTDESELPSEPEPFEEMPLVYERAYGGMTHLANPVGVGIERDLDGRVRLPNVYYDGPHDEDLPAGFGPIPSVWPSRRGRRGSISHGEVNNLSWVELPHDLDESYFQCAPRDQWVGELRAGDVLTLTGMHASLETVRLVVPAYQGAAQWTSPRGEALNVSLRLDTLFVAAESLVCELLHRATIQVPRHDLHGSYLLGTLHLPQQGFRFQSDYPLERTSSLPPPPPRPKSFHGTEIIEPEEAPHRGLGSTVVMDPDVPTAQDASRERKP